MVRRWAVLIGLAVLVLVIAIQVVPVETTNPPVEGDIPTSPEVKAVLRHACYDCHSKHGCDLLDHQGDLRRRT